MIRIDIDDINQRRIKNRHWLWFKSNMLKNWITRINRDSEETFLRLFFNSPNEFKEWFSITNKQSITQWIAQQDDNKFSVFKNFIVGDISTLIDLKSRIESQWKEKDIDIIDREKKYFKGQYNIFRNSKEEWGGAYFVNELGLRVCPYCNRNYIDTYEYDEKKRLKSTAQIDHFFPIEIFPYLAVSICNLVPSCYSCNSSKSNNTNLVIYPYKECFGNDATFKTVFLSGKGQQKDYDIKYLLGETDNFEVKIEVHTDDVDKHTKIMNSITTFNLKNLYNLHKDIVRNLIKKSIIYNESKLDELYSEYGTLFKSREELMEMIISNYIDEKDIGKGSLSKLTSDICKELGIR